MRDYYLWTYVQVAKNEKIEQAGDSPLGGGSCPHKKKKTKQTPDKFDRSCKETKKKAGQNDYSQKNVSTAYLQISSRPQNPGIWLNQRHTCPLTPQKVIVSKGNFP